MARTLLMAPTGVRRTMRRIAAEVVERNRGVEQLVLFGVERRGLAVAGMLAEALREVAGRSLDVNPLNVSGFRDDRPAEERAPEPAGPAVVDHDVLVVDDVLFTGRTARAAIDAVLSRGRPSRLQLAVLIDRGHRELPVQADYVGRVIPTRYRERVVVDVNGDAAVYLDE